MADRSVRVRLSLSAADFNRGLTQAGQAANRFARNLNDVDNRMSGVVQTSLALGPALIPTAAAATGGIAALANQMGFAAVGAGTAVLAFQGVGDALTAVNEFAIEPTAENLETMRQKMATLGPAGQDFVRFLQNLRPEMQALQDAAQAGLFPGVQEGLRELMDLFPVFEGIVSNVGAAMGDLAADAGEALTSPFWQDFFRWIGTDASLALDQLGRSIGNIVEGISGMAMGFDPLADDIGAGLVQMTDDFAKWGRELGSTEGFRDFTEYIRDIGPKLVDTFAALGGAFVELVEAAAPIGGASLTIIQGLAKALGAIADIPVLGPTLIAAAAGISAVSRAVALWKASSMGAFINGLRGIDSEGKKASAAMTGLSRAGAALAGVSIAVGVIENIGEALSDTLPGINEMQNRLLDLATGKASSLGSQFDDLAGSIENVANPKWHDNLLEAIGLPASREMRESQEQIDAIDNALASLASTEGPEVAKRALQGLIDAQGLSRKEAQDLIRSMPAYREALEGAGLDARLAAGDFDDMTKAERDAQQATKDLAKELLDLSENLERRSALRGYREAVRDFYEILEDGPKKLRRGTAAWDEAEAGLDAIAAGALAAANELKGINKVRALQEGRRDFIKAAEAMGMTEKQARNLADRLGLVNQRGKIDILLREKGMDDATQKLGRIKERADDIPDRIDTRVEGNTHDADRDLEVTADKMKDLDRFTAEPDVKVDTSRARGDVSAFTSYFEGALGGIRDEQVNVELSGLAKLALTGSGPLMKAAGGDVPGHLGRPGRDSVPALLMPDEHVVTTAEVKAAGKGSAARGHRIWQGIRHAALMGALPDPMDLPAYAFGGAVDVAPRVSRNGFPSAIGIIERAFGGVVDRIGENLSKRINEMYQFGGGVPLGPGGNLSRGQILMGQRFAQAQDGKPYIWGGVGPRGYDCSGFQSAIINAALGRNPYQRIGSTGTMPWPGMGPGTGLYTIGWFTGDPGHTSGNIGGLGVESTGDHVRTGGAARSPLDAMFNHVGHYDSGGPLYPGYTLAYNGTGETEYVVRGYAEGGKVTDAERKANREERRERRQEREQEARQNERAFEKALRQFNIDKPGMTREDVKGELRDLREGLRDALGKDAPILKTLDRLDKRILDETKDRAKLIRANEKLEEQLRNLKDQRDQLASSVAGNFRNDIFSGGAEDLSLQLRADTNDARRANRARRELERKGLSGGIYRGLMESGNVLLMQELANMSRKQLQRFERMYATRQQTSGRLGMAVGNEIYGQDIRENNKETRANTKALNRHTREIRQQGRRLIRQSGGARRRARSG